MKYREFIRWLKAQGCVVTPGKGSHVIATNPKNNKSMGVPTHGKHNDIPEGTRKSIIKFLELSS